MATYSELITSFERAGKFPLEADYIFDSEDALRAWASEGISAATLHEGLLKVVLSDPDGKQGLYWVVQDGSGGLSFTELLSASDSDSLAKAVEDLAALSRTVLEVQEALRALGEAALSGDDSLRAQIRAIVGCDDDETVMEVIGALNHGDLKRINEWIDAVDLGALADDLWNRIEGDPTPSTKFQTLRGVEDFVSKAAADNAYAHENIIREIDKVETGVGLNADGSYSPDPTTKYLTDATSVMHALRILDSLIDDGAVEVLEDAHYDPDTESIVMVFALSDGTSKTVSIPVAGLIEEWEPENADGSAVVLTRTRHEGGAPDTLSADLKVSADEGNAVERRADGIYVDGTDSEWITLNDGGGV